MMGSDRGRIRRLAASLLALVLVVLVGCGGRSSDPHGAEPSGGGAAEPVTVRIAWSKVLQQMHWGDIAQYLDPSVKVEILDFKTTNDQLFALQAGSLDFSVMGYNQLASALVQGPVDATLIAGLSNAPTRLVARPDLEINDWSDLKGLRIGGARGSTQYMQISIEMKKHGIDVNQDVEFVQFKGAPEMLVGLQQGAADAIMIWEPQASQAIVEGFGKDVEVVSRTLYEDSFSSGNAIVVSNKFLEAHPDVVQKVVDAYWKSYQRIASDEQYWKETFHELTGMDMAVLDLAARNARPEYWMPVDQIRTITTTMYELGFLEKDVTDQVLARLDYSFLEKATGKSKEELGGK